MGIGSVYEQAPLDELDEQLARTFWPSPSINTKTDLRPEHTRFVYHLQESTAQSSSDSEDNDEDEESDTSASRSGSRRGSRRSGRRSVRSGKTRMSLLTGEVFDVPDVPRLEERANGYFDLGCGHEPWAAAVDASVRGARRHFFHGASRWDADLQEVVLLERQRSGLDATTLDIAALMAHSAEDDWHRDSSEPADEMEVDSDDA